jgi:hypothetical protein
MRHESYGSPKEEEEEAARGGTDTIKEGSSGKKEGI